MFSSPFSVSCFTNSAKFVVGVSEHEEDLNIRVLFLNVKMFGTVTGSESAFSFDELVWSDLEVWGVCVSNIIFQSLFFINTKWIG